MDIISLWRHRSESNTYYRPKICRRDKRFDVDFVEYTFAKRFI